MYLVRDFYLQHGPLAGLTLIGGKAGLKRPIKIPEVHRPGLTLSGYMKEFARRRILVFGNMEISYLRDLPEDIRKQRLSVILNDQIPCVVIAGRFRPVKEMVQICNQMNISLFKTKQPTTHFIHQLAIFLSDEFKPKKTLHGTLVEAFGIGVLIQGESSIGKSEAALGLIERGHRLITDDMVKVRVREGSWVEGSGVELSRHMLEIRGIGIINVAHIYGAVCVRDEKKIDLVIKLEEWDESRFYDRVGLEEKWIEILGISLPFHTLPVKPGRDVVLLIETIVLNHRLKEMGYHSAKEFNVKLLETIRKKRSEALSNS